MIDKNCGFKDFTKVVRQDILKMICAAKSGHPGGSLSCVEILSVLYRKILNIPPDWKSLLILIRETDLFYPKGMPALRRYPDSGDGIRASICISPDGYPTFSRTSFAVQNT